MAFHQWEKGKGLGYLAEPASQFFSPASLLVDTFLIFICSFSTIVRLVPPPVSTSCPENCWTGYLIFLALYSQFLTYGLFCWGVRFVLIACNFENKTKHSNAFFVFWDPTVRECEHFFNFETSILSSVAREASLTELVRLLFTAKSDYSSSKMSENDSHKFSSKRTAE